MSSKKKPPATVHERYKNFLISGSGRCGTRFLAHLMNRSEKWTVLHEPGPPGIHEYTTSAQCESTLKRFEHDYYGEVNSMLRRIFINLYVAKRGLLVRNPYDVYLSIANRRGTETKYIEEFKESLQLMDYALSNKNFKVKKIEFEKLTTDVDYAKGILEYFDIDDVEITEEDIHTKVNFTEEKKFKTINDLPPNARKQILIASERFLERRAND